MDLKSPVQYREYELNTTTRAPSASGGLITGCQLNAVDFSVVPAVGYTEKRALGDGRDASDVYSDGRRIDLRGQVFGATRSSVYDQLRDLRALFNARLAFDENPALQGYLRLAFAEPTLVEENAYQGSLYFVMYARPVGEPSFQIVRDLLGGAESKGGTIMWQAALECKDPRVYVDAPVYTVLVGTGTSGIGLTNQGNYPTPFYIQLVIPAALGAGTFTATLNGKTIVIDILDSGFDQVYRYDGQKKTLHLTKQGVTTLKMSLLTTSHPEVMPGANTLAWTSTLNLPAGAGFDTYSLAQFAAAFA